jgi:plasmid replication initiation protein
MSTDVIERDERDLVVKSNALIEASYRMTLVEQQLVLFAICAGREQEKMLTKSSLIPIYALDFAKQFNINHKTVYEQLKEAANTLFNRLIFVHDTHPKSGKPRTRKIRWVSEVAYTDGDGLVEFQFNERLIPYITRLEAKYTRYELGNVARMTSIHAIRIYELLSQYLTIGARRFELLKLKGMLGVKNEYSEISDFKKRVLDVAVAQINEHSDLKISYTQEKSGRVVTAIVFSIRIKTAALAAPKKPKSPTPIALPLQEPAPKSEAPAVLAERAKAKAALSEMKKKSGLRVVKTERKST